MKPEQYSPKQAEAEAAAMTRSLESAYPGQNNFSNEQYDAAHRQETDEIYKTSIGTVRDLAESAEIPAAQEIWHELGGIEENKQFADMTVGKPHLVELRYRMSDAILREAASQEKIKQAVEIASGFTPHAIELVGDKTMSNYVETDLPVNAIRKEGVVTKVKPGLEVGYVPGSAYDSATWTEIENKLEDGPVAIFSEGFMLYTSREERDELAKSVKGILEKHGGFFMFEDSTRFHPEYKDLPMFRAFFQKLEASSQRDLGSITQEDMTREWEERGFAVERIPEEVSLVSEGKFPGSQEEIGLIRRNYKMWKLSLLNPSESPL